jgi:hypothetical protein
LIFDLTVADSQREKFEPKGDSPEREPNDLKHGREVLYPPASCEHCRKRNPGAIQATCSFVILNPLARENQGRRKFSGSKQFGYLTNRWSVVRIHPFRRKPGVAQLVEQWSPEREFPSAEPYPLSLYGQITSA